MRYKLLVYCSMCTLLCTACCTQHVLQHARKRSLVFKKASFIMHIQKASRVLFGQKKHAACLGLSTRQTH